MVIVISIVIGLLINYISMAFDSYDKKPNDQNIISSRSSIDEYNMNPITAKSDTDHT